MPDGQPHGSGLLGRDRECEALDRLMADVHAGQSRALVLRGEAGVGKSALLEHLLGSASGCRIARAAGVESEMELPFAGLHQLCGPFLDRLDHLPGPQRDALGTVFGRRVGPAPDRFIVGLAVLGLLSDVAHECPLVCVVDDAQWQDRATVQTLGFVARRLMAESVGLVFAVRAPDDTEDLTGLPELEVGGVSDGDARTLLDRALPGRLDEHVRERVVAETRGNPLALLELPRGLTVAELAGGFGLPGALPLTTRIEQSFVRQLNELPPQTRQLLLVAAAEPVGDVNLLWQAARQLGLTTDAAEPAQTAGLIELGVRVRFRHPLVRSAAYRTATAHDRREAHRALAAATDPSLDPDRRAWHRARAAVGPDEDIAGELERSAGRARARGGVAAAAAFLARATELSADPALRAARTLAAAQAKFDAAAPDTALEILASAEPAKLDELDSARHARLRAQIAFARTRGADSARLLLDAAQRLDPFGPELAREAYLEALRAAIFAGRLIDGTSVRAVAEAARGAPPAAQPPRAIDLLLDGLTTRFTEGYAAGAAPLGRALEAFRHEGDPTEDDKRWLWLACPVAPEPVGPDLWDDATWELLCGRAVAMARDAGALTVLPIALTARASVHVMAGEFAAADVLITESDAISAATGNAPLPYTSVLLAGWRGDTPAATALIADGIARATATGEGRAIGLAEHATAVLHNGLGQHSAALAAARRACAYDDPGFYGWSLIELVEAAAREGARDEAHAALEQLEERTRAVRTSWAVGVACFARALLSDDDGDADTLYREAVDRLGGSRIVLHAARAQLLYGEWLRRAHRRADAREQLRAAHETFHRCGAEAFAERAGRELAATGQVVARRAAPAPEHLTPQEAQIARLAADGRTNPEIGAELFISPRTVEYHLAKVFTKLGITSRRELRQALPQSAQALALG